MRKKTEGAQNYVNVNACILIGGYNFSGQRT